MFTGIVTDLATVRAIVPGGVTRFEIATAYDVGGIAIGASIAHNGACLTVIEKGAGWYAVEVSRETLDKTTLGTWKVGSRINLERAMKVGEELGGHIVSGHVDGVAVIEAVRPDGASLRYTIAAPADLARFVAPKGSVALDGVSLTVNEVEGARFGVNLIPHTRAVTTFGQYRAGDRLNMEIDMLARYVARLLQQN